MAEWRPVNDLKLELFKKEIVAFKEWSGRYQIRLLILNNISKEYPFHLGGSGSLLKYQEKKFLITNYHVIRSVNNDERCDSVLPIMEEDVVISSLNFVKYHGDSELDIAVFEFNSQGEKEYSKGFLPYESVMLNPLTHLKNRCNSLMVHGTPEENAELDFEINTVYLETFPYFTFATDYDEEIGLIEASADINGVDENGNIVDVPGFNHLSGSWVYCFDAEKLDYPYKVIGIATRGRKESRKLWITKVDDIIRFIDEKFF